MPNDKQFAEEDFIRSHEEIKEQNKAFDINLDKYSQDNMDRVLAKLYFQGKEINGIPALEVLNMIDKQYDEPNSNLFADDEELREYYKQTSILTIDKETK